MPNFLLGQPNGSLSASWATSTTGVVKTGQLQFVVFGEDLTTGEESIRATAGLPQIYVFYVPSGMYCVGVTAKQDTPAKHPVTEVDTWRWLVDVEFSSEMDEDEDNPTPLTKPLIREWNSETEVSGWLTRDAVTGNRVETTAGEQLYVERVITTPILSVQRYGSYPFSPVTILAYANAVNDAPFYGAPIGTALMLKVSAKTETVKNIHYENETYVIKFLIDPDNPAREDTWKAFIPNQGSFYLSEPKPAGHPLSVDRYGNPSGPFALKADGTLDPAGVGTDPIEVNKFRKADFDALGIGP